jgi:hypothetical protein
MKDYVSWKQLNPWLYSFFVKFRATALLTLVFLPAKATRPSLCFHSGKLAKSTLLGSTPLYYTTKSGSKPCFGNNTGKFHGVWFGYFNRVRDYIARNLD